MAEKASNQARLNLKTNRHCKQQLEKAAELSGMTLTGFVIMAACDKAREVLAHFNQEQE